MSICRDTVLDSACKWLGLRGFRLENKMNSQPNAVPALYHQDFKFVQGYFFFFFLYSGFSTRFEIRCRKLSPHPRGCHKGAGGGGPVSWLLPGRAGGTVGLAVLVHMTLGLESLQACGRVTAGGI